MKTNLSFRMSLAVLSVASLLSIISTNAEAGRCQRLAASAIAIGKDQSVIDAKEELSSYITSWTAKQGIKNVRRGKTSVTCKDWIVLLNEYKCRAEASFCW